jgi:hypothetical protein
MEVSMIKVLFLAANPKDTDPLRLGEESREIKQRLRAAELRDQFTFEQEHAVRVTDLQEHLLRHQPHIVHFSGHGSAAGNIVLENALGRSKAVTATALKDLFSTLKDNIRCVVLNACHSDAQANGIIQSIDCVVGMSRAVDDRSAVAFASSFYQGLGYGRSIKTAFDLGRGQINLQSLPGKDVPKLRTAPGLDAATIYLVGHGATASTATQSKPKSGAGDASAEATSLDHTERHSCFISYSHQDEAFAEKLHSRLTANGVDVWYAPEDIKGGLKIYDQVSDAIRKKARLLLVLSEHSMNSEWVKTEIAKARQAEIRAGERKLFPIRLVDMQTIREWECFDAEIGKDSAVEIREYFIPDFSKWQDNAKFEKSLDSLLRDLKTAV